MHSTLIPKYIEARIGGRSVGTRFVVVVNERVDLKVDGVKTKKHSGTMATLIA